jgi:hypothetical protein
VLTGWIAGPKTIGMAHLGESELIEIALASLANTFELPPARLAKDLAAGRRSTGLMILSLAEPIPTLRSKRVRHTPRSQARAVRFSFPAKRFIAGRT